MSEKVIPGSKQGRENLYIYVEYKEKVDLSKNSGFLGERANKLAEELQELSKEYPDFKKPTSGGLVRESCVMLLPNTRTYYCLYCKTETDVWFEWIRLLYQKKNLSAARVNGSEVSVANNGTYKISDCNFIYYNSTRPVVR